MTHNLAMLVDKDIDQPLIDLHRVPLSDRRWRWSCRRKARGHKLALFYQFVPLLYVPQLGLPVVALQFEIGFWDAVDDII